MQYGTFKKPYLAGNKNKPQYMEYKGGKDSVLGESGAPAEEEEAGQYGWFSVFDNAHWDVWTDEYRYTYWTGWKWADDGYYDNDPDTTELEPPDYHGWMDAMIYLKVKGNWEKDFRPTKMKYNSSYTDTPDNTGYNYVRLSDENSNSLLVGQYAELYAPGQNIRINWASGSKSIKYFLCFRTGNQPMDLTELEFYIPKS